MAHGNGNGSTTSYSELPNEHRCNCSTKYGPYRTSWGHTNVYAATCAMHSIPPEVENWQKQRTCPKGWGRRKSFYPNDTYSVSGAQGYINDNSTPVYSYITKYRDAYHNYITTRVAKA